MIFFIILHPFNQPCYYWRSCAQTNERIWLKYVILSQAICNISQFSLLLVQPNGCIWVFFFVSLFSVWLLVLICRNSDVHLCGKGTALVSGRGSEFWVASGAIRSSSVPLMLSGVKGDCRSPVADSYQNIKNKIIGFRSSCFYLCTLNDLSCREDFLNRQQCLAAEIDG